MRAFHELTVTEAVLAIRTGSLSPVALTEALLKRVEALEPKLRAWVTLDRDGALQTARTREAEVTAGRILGPLHGVPVGIKDIYHVAGMVTTCGAGPFAHERPTADAATVERLRAAGAVILGKTTTTEFAYLDPAETRNPWNLEHTPGGSSSGSAAAVAARLVPAAFGTQTVGSVLRPAAYCGVVGLKPTHGRISCRGIIPLAWSLDHVGFLVRSVDDAALVFGVLAGYDPEDPQSINAPVPDYSAALAATGAPPRLGFLRDFFLEKASAEVAAHVEAVAAALALVGARVEEVKLPSSFEGLHAAGATVMRAEAAAYHTPRFEKHAAEYRPKISEVIELGQAVSAVEYLAAKAHLRRFRLEADRLAEGYDALLMPVAPAPAPKGLASTGDGSFCAPWSFSGLPAITIPSGLSPDGLPIGLQLASAAWSEPRLLAAARWCERALAFREVPIH